MRMYRAQIILEKPQHEMLVRIAREEGKSISETVRDLLELAFHERRRQQMEQAAQALLEDYRNDPELITFTALDGEAVQEMV